MSGIPTRAASLDHLRATQCMGMALMILVASGLLVGDRGLGFVVLDASSFFRTSYVFAGTIVIGTIGLAADRGIAWLNRRLVHWEGKR